MNAPEPYLPALLHVIDDAIVDARATAARATAKDADTQNEALKRIFSLMDVIHNIPQMLSSFEDWDMATFKKDLRAYDEKWSSMSSTGIRLLRVYESSLKDSRTAN